MTATDDRVLTLASYLDPEGTPGDPREQDVAAETTLRRILAEPHSTAGALASAPATRPPVRRPITRRPLVLAGAATALAVGLVTLGGLTPSNLLSTIAIARADTPPMLAYSDPGGSDGASPLLAIADAAAAAPESPASGTYRYTHWQEWSFRGGDNEPDRIAPVERWTWLAADGSARTRNAEDGAVGEYMDWPVGGMGLLPNHWSRLSGTPEQVTSELEGAPGSEGSRAFRLIAAYLDILRVSGQPAPEERATVLRALAATDATTYGQVEDRAGRTGIAFGAMSPRGDIEDELRIIVDPVTGEVLASESIMHGLLILGSTSAVTDYFVFLESAWTDDLPACGDIGCRTMPPPG